MSLAELKVTTGSKVIDRVNELFGPNAKFYGALVGETHFG